MSHSLLKKFRFRWKEDRDLQFGGRKSWNGEKNKADGPEAEISSTKVFLRGAVVKRSNREGLIRVNLLDGDGNRLFKIEETSSKLHFVVSFWFKAIEGVHKIDVHRKYGEEYFSANPKITQKCNVSKKEKKQFVIPFTLDYQDLPNGEIGISIHEETIGGTPSAFKISKIEFCVIDSESH